jgi:hypothetical protein
MNRKRILLCQNQADGFNSLLGLISYYFGAADTVFVNLPLKQDRFLSEVGSLSAVVSTPEKRIRSATDRLPRSRRSHRGYEATVKDLLREARFSDVLVMEDAYYQQLCDHTTASGFPLYVSCPILVAPAGEERVEQIILVDDGAPTTYQQIKYMACLLPKLCRATPTTLLLAHHHDGYVSAQEEKLWINYLKLHFAHLAVHRVDQQSARMLSMMVDYTKNALMISPTPTSPPLLHRVLAPLKRFRLILQAV